MTRPLPEDVARTARAYLAALVPAGEVSDAWHELVADATYWREDELVPVVRLAHQVALQHQPVAPQVAVLALREVGMGQPSAVARVLDVDEDTARGWTREVGASLDDAPETAAAPETADDADAAEGPDPSGGPEVAPDTDAPTSSPTSAPADEGSAVRIGFEEDGPVAALDELDSPASTTPRRGMVVAALVVAVLVILVVWVVGR